MLVRSAARLIDTANYLELEAILRPFLKSSIDKRRNDIVLWDSWRMGGNAEFSLC